MNGYLNDTIYYRTLNASGTWTWQATPPGTPTTDDDLAAVTFNGKLYLFYKQVGTGLQPIRYLTWTPGVGWQGPNSTGAQTRSGIAAVAPLEDKLWIVFRYDTGAGSLRYQFMNAAGTWSGLGQPSRQGSFVFTGSPTARIFLDRLHVAVTAGTQMAYASHCTSGLGCTYRPGEWTQFVELDPDGRHTTLFQEDGGYLYLFHRGGSTDSIYWRRKRSE